MKEFYQSRKSQRLVTVAVMGNKIPLYGSGASLSSTTGVPTVPVPLKLSFVLRSRAYVLGKLVKPKYHKRIECSITLDPKKLNALVSLKNSCTYDWWCMCQIRRGSTWERNYKKKQKDYFMFIWFFLSCGMKWVQLIAWCSGRVILDSFGCPKCLKLWKDKDMLGSVENCGLWVMISWKLFTFVWNFLLYFDSVKCKMRSDLNLFNLNVVIAFFFPCKYSVINNYSQLMSLFDSLVSSLIMMLAKIPIIWKRMKVIHVSFLWI